MQVNELKHGNNKVTFKTFIYFFPQSLQLKKYCFNEAAIIWYQTDPVCKNSIQMLNAL